MRRFVPRSRPGIHIAAITAAALVLPAPAAGFIEPPDMAPPAAAPAIPPDEFLELLNRGPFLPLRAPADRGDGLGAGRGHEGVDLFAPVGTPVIAVSNGVVLESGTDGGRGNYISVYSPTEDYTYNYFHLLAPSALSRTDLVLAGTLLGRLGCTGSCYGAHLHFEVRRGADPYGPVVDPVPFLAPLPEDPLPAPIPGA